MLGLRDGDAGDLGPDLLGGKFGKTAPAAANLKNGLVGLQVHRARERGVFVVLGLAQGLVGPVEPCRRIGHGGIEPARIEGVAQIIMGIDVALRALLAVAVEQVGQEIDHPDQRIAIDQPREAIPVHGEGLQHRGEVWRIPFIGNETLAKADVTGGHDPSDEPEVVNNQQGVRPRLGTLNPKGQTRGQHEAHRAIVPVGLGDAHGGAKGRRGSANLWQGEGLGRDQGQISQDNLGGVQRRNRH